MVDARSPHEFLDILSVGRKLSGGKLEISPHQKLLEAHSTYCSGLQSTVVKEHKIFERIKHIPLNEVNLFLSWCYSH